MTTPPVDQPRICVLGSIIMDLVVRAPRLPRAGETILGGPFASFPGGKGANQAVAAARMGAAVRMIGAVGGDDVGREMLGALRAEGVDTTGVAVLASPTGRAVVAVVAGGENSIIVDPGANHGLTPAHVGAAREAIATSDVAVMQLEVPMEAAVAFAALARDCGTTLIVNAAPVPEGGIAAEVLAAADVLVVNETEAAMLSRCGPEIEPMLERLAVLGPRVVIVTIGEHGARYKVERQPTGAIAAFRVDAIDTVGAGDAFVGALAMRWSEHQIGGALDGVGVMDALCWAAAAGALATTRSGAMPSLPRRSDIVALLRGSVGA